MPTPCKFILHSQSFDSFLILYSVWGIADGARKVSVDTEIIAYAILDVLAKAVFGAWLLIVHANMRESDAELNGFWANGLSREGAIRIGEDDGA